MGKAERVPGIHPGKLATLEAIIKKKHVTHRSQVTVSTAEPEKDTESENMLTAILTKYTGHKRVLLFKSNFEKDGKLSVVEKEELARFYKLLIADKARIKNAKG